MPGRLPKWWWWWEEGRNLHMLMEKIMLLLLCFSSKKEEEERSQRRRRRRRKFFFRRPPSNVSESAVERSRQQEEEGRREKKLEFGNLGAAGKQLYYQDCKGHCKGGLGESADAQADRSACASKEVCWVWKRLHREDPRVLYVLCNLVILTDA